MLTGEETPIASITGGINISFIIPRDFLSDFVLRPGKRKVKGVRFPAGERVTGRFKGRKGRFFKRWGACVLRELRRRCRSRWGETQTGGCDRGKGRKWASWEREFKATKRIVHASLRGDLIKKEGAGGHS